MCEVFFKTKTDLQNSSKFFGKLKESFGETQGKFWGNSRILLENSRKLLENLILRDFR